MGLQKEIKMLYWNREASQTALRVLPVVLTAVLARKLQSE
jgi:hypothetical protein